MAEQPAVASTEIRINLRYRGVAVDRGRMGARELGPAIHGLGLLVSRTSHLIYRDEARVQVEVRADFERASFGIEFFAVSPASGLLAPLSLDDLVYISALLGLGASPAKTLLKGLIEIARLIRGQKVINVEIHGDVFNINTEGGSVQITKDEYNLIADPEIRAGLKEVVRPLEREGVEEVEIGVEGSKPVRIERAERTHFEIPPPPDELIDMETSRRIVEVISPTFREENKWRFAEGEVTYFAEVADERFMEKVARRDFEFGQGDALRVEMETRTTRVEDKLTYERRIIRVLDHIKPTEGAQRSLPFGEQT